MKELLHLSYGLREKKIASTSTYVRFMVKSVSIDPKKHQHDLHRLLLSV